MEDLPQAGPLEHLLALLVGRALTRCNLVERAPICLHSHMGVSRDIARGQWMKETLFEYSANVSLMMCGPGIWAQGSACRRTVEFLDIYPTLADLCNLTNVPGGLHGRSLRGLLQYPDAYWDRPAVTQVQRVVQGVLRRGYSLRTEKYRYTMWNGSAAGEELYDYETDSLEQKNIASEFRLSSLKAELKDKLQSIIASRQA